MEGGARARGHVRRLVALDQRESERVPGVRETNRTQRLWSVVKCLLAMDQRESERDPGVSWPSQDIAMANIVWCMAYTRGAGGVSNIAQ